MSKNFAKFIIVNSFTLAAEVTWGLRNLCRGWSHIKLRNNFQPAIPCCTNNRRARPLFVASSKAIRLILLVVSPQLFRSDKFFIEIVGQHWFPTKLGIDQFLYICFLAVNFIFECRSRHFEYFRCFFFFNPISSV